MSNRPLGTLRGPVQASISEVKIIPSLWLMLNSKTPHNSWTNSLSFMSKMFQTPTTALRPPLLPPGLIISLRWPLAWPPYLPSDHLAYCVSKKIWAERRVNAPSHHRTLQAVSITPPSPLFFLAQDDSVLLAKAVPSWALNQGTLDIWVCLDDSCLGLVCAPFHSQEYLVL